ncbi:MULTISPECIES: DegV family protein [unclassified Ruminococcus]|uniref:DegV family protein n=1 Tax=unclassified Ruminococcus TaxID=2608920 RepID=UPI00210DB18A|nr:MULTISPECIES: DegV family protein [unclassified Ruminococcus]MCQ4021607.1 DegV family EDD domain-containing protein [Ruminococcus sp. zg-924]MCQ4114052.1 DegV family EDD domain-containing protein [Ruminococcus sp. zg-921]
MSKKVIITADSTCDLNGELIDRYGIRTIPLHITMNNKCCEDMVNITPDEIYDNFYKTGSLPKTSAISVGEYLSFFEQFTADGLEVVHINLGGALSSSAQNAAAAAKELSGVYTIDSRNLSSATGLLVIEAALAAENGLSGKEIADKVSAMTAKTHASFIIDKLNFLRAGGRCSTLAMLGANLLNLKPCIEVNNNDGSMTVGKKYRGKLEKVLAQYVEERLSQYDSIKNDRIFITHSGISREIEQAIYELIKSKNYFNEIHITRASCTISSHCGPNTLGILFMTE